MPICYLDRDGVFNHHLPYVGTLDRFIWHSEIIDILKILRGFNYRFILVTNQSGIGRGFYSFEEFSQINKVIHEKLKSNDLSIEVRFCPHIPNDKCKCRKPNTGMIDNDLRTKQDIFIGDQPSDMLCAFNGGILHRWMINRKNCKNATRWAENHKQFLFEINNWYVSDIKKTNL